MEYDKLGVRPQPLGTHSAKGCIKVSIEWDDLQRELSHDRRHTFEDIRQQRIRTPRAVEEAEIQFAFKYLERDTTVQY